jgi:hypothetical protein
MRHQSRFTLANRALLRVGSRVGSVSIYYETFWTAPRRAGARDSPPPRHTRSANGQSTATRRTTEGYADPRAAAGSGLGVGNGLHESCRYKRRGRAGGSWPHGRAAPGAVTAGPQGVGRGRGRGAVGSGARAAPRCWDHRHPSGSFGAAAARRARRTGRAGRAARRGRGGVTPQPRSGGAPMSSTAPTPRGRRPAQPQRLHRRLGPPRAGGEAHLTAATAHERGTCPNCPPPAPLLMSHAN